jgi:isopentenyl-diphosphate delta-isomerase
LQAAGTVEDRAAVGGGMVEHEVVALFRAEAGPELPLALNPFEVGAVRWIGLSELDRELQRWPERFTPWMRIYMARYREQIFDQGTTR